MRILRVSLAFAFALALVAATQAMAGTAVMTLARLFQRRLRA